MKQAGANAISFTQKPPASCWAALIFGDDPGVVDDTAAELIRSWTPADKPLDIITLEDDAIRREPALLFDALAAQSLLGDECLIRVRTTGDKLSVLLLEAMQGGEDRPSSYATKLVILAGALQKRSKLRAGFEAAKQAVALHVFADEIGNVSELVTISLKASGATIEPDALNAFIGDLPGHRGLARAEIEKLSLYAHGLDRALTRSDVEALSATDIDHALGAVIEAALDGRVADTDAQLDRVILAGTSPISVLRAMQREAQRLLQAHTLAGGAGGNIGMKLRPPVWNNEWPAFQKRLTRWPPTHLIRILERLYDAEKDAKSASALAEPALRILMNDLARTAARSKAA